MERQLPYNADYYASENKKFKEVVVFVPFYGGSKKSLKRHAEFVNKLGYDCVLFNLVKESIHPDKLPISSQMDFGMKHVWADQIEQICNQIPGPKIIFAFSNPSASAIECISRRKGNDISALVCDSGPSGEVWKSIYNYFTHEKPLSNFLFKGVMSTLSTLAWSPLFQLELSQDLTRFPKNFPVLTIRGWKDKLITPHMIDKVFEKHHQLQLQKLNLPKAGHLNGLRDFSEEYIPPVTDFLARHSSKDSLK